MTLNILYALLGLSVIVSLFGVINTLVLSVFERTRELGMLRAIGMTRRQVRRMIRHESIVTALIGAALGIARRHLPRRAHDARAVRQYGIVFAVPYGTLVVFVGIAILAGMLAAILPGAAGLPAERAGGAAVRVTAIALPGPSDEAPPRSLSRRVGSPNGSRKLIVEFAGVAVVGAP